MELTAAAREECEELLTRYPAREGALLPVLRLVQREQGYLSPEGVRFVADLLGLPPARVSGVISFHEGLRTEPVGEHLIAVCGSLPCSLIGAGEVVDYLREKLGIGSGETTADGRFTLVETGCMGACSTGPVMMIDGELHQSLTRELIDQLLEKLL